MKEKLEIRKMLKAKKPQFRRQNAGLKKKLASSWRRPRGYQSKLRLRKKSRGGYVSPGYKAAKEVRGLSREGLIPVRVSSLNELKELNKKHIVVLSGTLGLKKRLAIIEAGLKQNLRFENVKQPLVYLETKKKEFLEKIKKKQKKVKKSSIDQKVAKEAKQKEEKQETDKQEKEKQEKDKLLTKRQ